MFKQFSGLCKQAGNIDRSKIRFTRTGELEQGGDDGIETVYLPNHQSRILFGVCVLCFAAEKLGKSAQATQGGSDLMGNTCSHSAKRCQML